MSAFLLLGNLEVARGSLDRAASNYQRGLQSNPRDVKLYIGLGTLLESKKQWQQAEDCYKKALEIRKA